MRHSVSDSATRTSIICTRGGVRASVGRAGERGQGTRRQCRRSSPSAGSSAGCPARRSPSAASEPSCCGRWGWGGVSEGCRLCEPAVRAARPAQCTTWLRRTQRTSGRQSAPQWPPPRHASLEPGGRVPPGQASQSHPDCLLPHGLSRLHCSPVDPILGVSLLTMETGSDSPA